MNLPPLNALRAFEVAARQQSFLLAAKELHVSAASISRFIKILEADLGFALFQRSSNGVKLTPQGGQYYLLISPILKELSQVSKDSRQQGNKQVIHITSIPAIAETWLVSRLWSFQQQFSDIEINLVLDDRLVDLGETNIWLNYSHGQYPKCDSYIMRDNYLTLVCSPDIAKSLNSPKDIFKHTMLVDIDWSEDWQTWLNTAKLKMQPSKQSEFERYSMVVNAAISGSGVAIGHVALIQNHLDMGTLVAPFDIKVGSHRQFRANIAQKPQAKSIKQFINWFSGYTHFEWHLY